MENIFQQEKAGETEATQLAIANLWCMLLFELEKFTAGVPLCTLARGVQLHNYDPGLSQHSLATNAHGLFIGNS